MIVKKYANRRLYDTVTSRYITQDELADAIRAGNDVQVLDAKTNEDLTQVTLTQIILESRRAGKLLPVALLTQLIRMNDDALAEFLGRYMSWAMDVYLSAKQGAQALSPYNPFAMAPFGAANALARMVGGVAGWRDTGPVPQGPPPAAPAPPSTASNGGDISEIRRELEALKKELKKRRR